MHPLSRRTVRVTAVLYADDVDQMKHRYGHGWTEQLRLMLEQNCKQHTARKRTLEDMMKDQADGN